MNSIIRYRIALLTLYIIFSLFYTLKNHLLLLSPTIYNSVTNLFAQDLVRFDKLTALSLSKG